MNRFTNKEENQHHLKCCILVTKHLIHKHKKIPHREWVVFYDHEDKIKSISYEVTKSQRERNERYKCPDILWQDEKGLWILELDGEVHYVKSEKTNKRNEFYKNNPVNYLVINIYEFRMGKEKADYRPIEKILKEVDDKIMEIKNG